MENRTKAVVLDTDVGTDDAVAFLAAGFLPGVHVDYITASKGNTSLDGAVRNAIILKNYLGLDAKIVRGQLPGSDKNVNESEKNTFHGNDGLANVSADMIKEMKLTDRELCDYVTYDDHRAEILQYDEIEYIITGPTTNLANLLDNGEFQRRLGKVYIMGGGINEFNCSHDTEFNFSKDPKSVRKILGSVKDITLFPLDLTNHQRICEEQINALEKLGTFSYYIPFLRHNRRANSEYNHIDAAVLHDIMPLLYIAYPDEFTTENMKIEADKYGAVRVSDNGVPVKAVMKATEGLLYDTLSRIFREHDKAR